MINQRRATDPCSLFAPEMETYQRIAFGNKEDVLSDSLTISWNRFMLCERKLPQSTVSSCDLYRPLSLFPENGVVRRD